MKVDPNKLQQIQELINSGSIFEAQLILDELLNSDEIYECEECGHLFDKGTEVTREQRRHGITQTLTFCSEDCNSDFESAFYDYDGIDAFLDGRV